MLKLGVMVSDVVAQHGDIDPIYNEISSLQFEYSAPATKLSEHCIAWVRHNYLLSKVYLQVPNNNTAVDTACCILC